MDNRISVANQRANAFVVNNENLIPTIRKINESAQNGTNDLFSTFKLHDVQGNGVLSKEEFINLVFDSVKNVKPSDLMQFVTAYVDNEEDEVKYEEFLHLI